MYVAVLQAHSFELECDTTQFAAYTRGGIVTQHKESKVRAETWMPVLTHILLVCGVMFCSQVVTGQPRAAQHTLARRSIALLYMFAWGTTYCSMSTLQQKLNREEDNGACLMCYILHCVCAWCWRTRGRVPQVPVLEKLAGAGVC